MANARLYPLAVLLAVCPTPFSVAYPTGAPTTACEHMTPLHQNFTPQTDPSPYSIKIDRGYYKNGEELNVQITGPDYEGILLQVREVNGTKPLGTWKKPPDNTTLLQCSGIDGSAITHANTNPKTNSVTYCWIAPSNECPEKIIITATVAEEFSTFWTGITYIVHRGEDGKTTER